MKMWIVTTYMPSSTSFLEHFPGFVDWLSSTGLLVFTPRSSLLLSVLPQQRGDVGRDPWRDAVGVHLGHPARPSHAAVHEGGELALGPPSPRLPQQLPVLLRDSSVQLDRVLLRELLLLAYALASRESRGPGSSCRRDWNRKGICKTAVDIYFPNTTVTIVEIFMFGNETNSI